MTSSITSALFAFTASNTGSTSQASSGDAALFESLMNQQSQGASSTAGNTSSASSGNVQGSSGFEAMMFSFSSETVTPASTTSGGTGTSAQGGLDQLLNMLEQMITDVENSIGNTGSNTAQASGTTNTTDANSSSLAASAIGASGPLPTFLAQVDSQMGLNATQQQALQGIAVENMNATNTPGTVNTIAQELQQAGI